MVASAISGKYFSANEQVIAEKLHQIIESAIITNFDQTNFASGAGLIVIGTSSPVDTDALWYDTNLSLLRLYDGTDWQPIGKGVVLTNDSGSTVTKGAVVVWSTVTDNAFTTTTTLNSTLVAGVAAETITNGSKGVIRTSGDSVVNLDGVGSGVFVGTGSVAGQGRSSNTKTAGQFGTILGAGPTNVPILLFGQPAL